MAFEGRAQGLQAFLGAKQAGAHPLAQHLNFKSALKEARIAMAAKSLEAERGRGFTARENALDRTAATDLQTQKDTASAQVTPEQLKIKDLFSQFEKVGGDFAKIRDSFDRLEASAEEPSAAGDLAMIFNYMKILDPDSVVRESEFATAQNSGAVPERVRGLYNSIINGKRLSNVQRKDFLNRGERLFNKKKTQFRKDEKGFRILARRNNINPDDFIRDLLRATTSVNLDTGGLPEGTLNLNNILDEL